MTSNDSKSIYTDGSCLENPGGASGWSFCVLERDKTWLISGGEASSTNNRMELTAVIEALEWVMGDKYTIYTDSLLTLNCAQGIWRRKANLDLWQRYDQASLGKTLEWHWVKLIMEIRIMNLLMAQREMKQNCLKNKNLVSK